MVNYAYTIRDKVSENLLVMQPIASNTVEQALGGDFNKAVEEALMDSNNAYPKQLLLMLSDPEKAKRFSWLAFDLLRLVG